MPPPARASNRPTPSTSLPFLLSQVGAHVSATFSDRIAPLGLKPYHAGILNILAGRAGLTQQALADLLGVFPSRIVGLLDDLAALKLIERRASASDRRTYALHLTAAGQKTWTKIGKLAAQLQEDLCTSLNEKDKQLLGNMLNRIVTQQKITPGVHPGFRRMDAACGD